MRVKRERNREREEREKELLHTGLMDSADIESYTTNELAFRKCWVTTFILLIRCRR